MNVKAYFGKYRKIINRRLKDYLPPAKKEPADLHTAMRYSVFSGGKRIRPILTIAAAQACGGRATEALKPACAIELVHTYTLIHDDLPAMDNDDYRRGRLSCHKKFGEANAILAGDALLTLAFNLLTQGKNPKKQLKIIHELSTHIGTGGTVAGQVVDVATKGRRLSRYQIEYINARKTGSLIAACLKIGAVAVCDNKDKIRAAESYGKHLGLVFQIVDDILDNEGYSKVLGRERAESEAERLTEKAKKSLRPLGPKAKTLMDISDYLLKRKK
jgi:geranylgeranyl diphosphate synthase type II